MSKLIHYTATTLDGFIADPDDGRAPARSAYAGRVTWTEIADVAQLTALLGEPNERAVDKERAGSKRAELTVEQLDDYYGPSYAERLYVP